MSRKKKSRAVGKRAASQPIRTTPKNSKVVNPIIIGAVTVTMLLVLVVTVLPGANTGQNNGRPAGSAQTVDNSTQQRITSLENTLATDPKNVGVLVQLGNDYFDTGQYGKAIDKYQAALDINPNDTNVIVDLGYSYFNLGMISQAIAQYRKALQIDPQKPQAHLNLAAALVSDNPPNVEEALSEWQKAIDTAGGNTDIINKAKSNIEKYKK
ncbi:MAG: tetratricopeptide repeat protein [Chloroflexi bacterium]|nr:tetratricopeptide repeat protein [Chloroflexota bacterium]